MTASLTAADRAKLGAILGRLGSDHAGERDAAALAANRFILARDMTWPDVLAGGITRDEVLIDFIAERMREHAEREAKRKANANDPKLKRRRAQRWALRFWDYHAEEIRRHRKYLTVDERAWFEDLEGRVPRWSRWGRTSADAMALQDLHSQLSDRAAQHRKTESAAREAEAVQ
jgi:hypothetical protein